MKTIKTPFFPFKNEKKIKPLISIFFISYYLIYINHCNQDKQAIICL